MTSLFANIPPIYLIYFFYGAAFLVLAATIAAKDMKGSELKLADSLWLLGLFGFTHGVHEWLQLYPLIEGDHLSYQAIYLTKLAALAIFIISYLALLWFGLSLLRVVSNRPAWFSRVIPLALALLWLLHTWHAGFTGDLQFLRQVSIGARHTFGLVGGFLTAYGLIAYSHEIKNLSRTASRNFLYAGTAFGFYALFAGVFASNFTLFRLPVPIEVLRGVAAVCITYFIVKALNIFDVEARRRVEQQTRRIILTEKLTSLGQLAAGIAHEINNPLTNASLGIQTLKAKMQDDGEQEAVLARLAAIEQNIDRAAVIARELLQFSRQRESAFIPLDMNTVVLGALTLLQYKLKDIEVRRSLAVLPDVMGDPGKLEQVIINLLSNAVEAMPAGGGIDISTARSGQNVKVVVRDTGGGIPEKNLSRVFDPFFTTKETGAGTGLGLSICYGIIKDHHGTIDITSAPGQGTVVTLTIPGGGEHETHSDRR